MGLLFPLLWSIRPSIEAGVLLFLSSLRLDWTPFMSLDGSSLSALRTEEFCFSSPLLMHSDWSFLTQNLTVVSLLYEGSSSSAPPCCPCVGQQQVKPFCLQTVSYRCSPLHRHIHSLLSNVISKTVSYLNYRSIFSTGLTAKLLYFSSSNHKTFLFSLPLKLL